MIRLTAAFCALFFYQAVMAQNIAPAITITQTTYNNNILTVEYSLADPENDACEITLHLSGDGIVYDLEPANVSGDAGFPVTSGTGKTITADLSGAIFLNNLLHVKLVADDLVAINIEDIVNAVSQPRMEEELAFVTGIRHYVTGTTHLQAVKDSIQAVFTDNEYALTTQEFTHDNYQAQNFIATKSGTTDEDVVYINCAHYDSVNNAPGADDNGTGVVGMLEAARVLGGYSFRKTIKLIAFDLEEEGLLGSIQYVGSDQINPAETIAGAMDYEMIGYYSEQPNTQIVPSGFELIFPAQVAQISADSFKGDFITNVANTTSQALKNAFNDAAAEYVPSLKVITLIEPGGFPLFDLRRSDHAPFWLTGHPALMLTDGANFRNPNYHTPADNYATINFEFMTQVVKATVATLAELAEVQHSTVANSTVEVPVATDGPGCAVKVFPNPSYGKLSVYLDGCIETQNGTVKISDIKGQVLKTVDTAGKSVIELENLQPGLYMVELTYANTNRVYKIIVK